MGGFKPNEDLVWKITVFTYYGKQEIKINGGAVLCLQDQQEVSMQVG